MDDYLRTLTELCHFLEAHGDRHCAPRLRNFVEEYSSMHAGHLDKSAHVEYFEKVIRAITGGMGSLSDLTLSPAGGHSLGQSSLRDVNRQKDALTEALYQSATKALAKAKEENPRE
jgi:hypothetical protein